jgi:phosphoglycolate phosphatase-like HAD superfamily hydrolase
VSEAVAAMPSPAFELVVLDLDGPVLDVRARYRAVHERLVVLLGLTPAVAARDFWEAKRSRTPLPALLGLREDHPSVRAYREGWLRLIEDDAQLALDAVQPGAREALGAIPAGVRKALVSMRTNRDGAAATLDRLALTACFDEIVWVAHSEGDKAAGVQGVVRQTEAKRVLVVGDTEVDLAAARAGGHRFVGVECGIRSREALSAMGVEHIACDLAAALAPLRSST